MADHTDRPAEPISEVEPTDFKPMSNVEEFSLPMTADDIARMDPRLGAAMASGLPLEDIDDDDEEDMDEGYVAVDHDDTSDFSYWFRRPPVHQRTQLDELHPFVQVLSVSNVDDCVQVENALPEPERCSREKFLYRLNKCPELSLGLFTLPVIPEGEPKPRPTLVGHVVAARSSAPRVTDHSMQMPANWRNERSTVENGETIGHDEYSNTIAVHSLAVLPEHQNKQVGTTLMKSYIQRIKEAAIADRIVLIAHDHLVPFYEVLGFENRGPSECKHGGGGWYDMSLELMDE